MASFKNEFYSSNSGKVRLVVIKVRRVLRQYLEQKITSRPILEKIGLRYGLSKQRASQIIKSRLGPAELELWRKIPKHDLSKAKKMPKRDLSNERLRVCVQNDIDDFGACRTDELMDYGAVAKKLEIRPHLVRINSALPVKFYAKSTQWYWLIRAQEEGNLLKIRELINFVLLEVETKQKFLSNAELSRRFNLLEDMVSKWLKQYIPEEVLLKRWKTIHGSI